MRRSALEARPDAKQLDQINLSFHLFPEDHDTPNPGRLIDETLYPDLLEQDKEPRFFYFVKRLVDITENILALVLGFPLLVAISLAFLVAISLAIRLTSKGPILFGKKGLAGTDRDSRS